MQTTTFGNSILFPFPGVSSGHVFGGRSGEAVVTKGGPLATTERPPDWNGTDEKEYSISIKLKYIDLSFFILKISGGLQPTSGY